MQQLDLFTWPITRLRRQYKGHPRIFARRLKLEMLRLLKEGL